MRIAITGTHGCVGSALVHYLSGLGHTVFRIVRGPASSAEEIECDFLSEKPGWDPLEGLDALIHLAGENIADGRWTASKIRRIEESRVRGTSRLATALRSLKRPPPTLLCASAVGYYGDRGTTSLDESSRPGSGFLPRVCQRWESAALAATSLGLRVCPMRFGMILGATGGPLPRMVRIFRAGLGGRLGAGNQYWSWVSLEDAVRAIEFLLQHEEAAGPFNVCAPEPVTNREFTRSLAKVLRRPALIPVPSPLLRLVLGPMADELLLSSARAYPQKLQELRFQFRHAQLAACFQNTLSGAHLK